MSKKHSDFQMNYISETGSLAQNNSYFDFVELDDFACWITADVNAEADKEIANIIIHSILKDFKDNPTISQQEMKEYIRDARELVVNMSENTPIKVGLAIAATDYSKMLCIATGNERLYHLQRMLSLRANAEQGLELGVDENDEKGRLYDYSDQNAVFGLFIAKTITLHDGDVIFICNSGFWKNVELNDISDTLQGVSEPFMFLYGLKSLLVHKQEETLISYTMVAIFINRISKKSIFNYMKTVAAVAVVMLLMIGLFVFKPFAKPHGQEREAAQTNQVTRAAQLNQNYFALYEQKGDSLVKAEEYSKALDEYNKALDCEDLKAADVRDGIQRKLEIAQMIIDADQLAAAGKFDAALAKYGAAKKAALEADTYERTGLQKRAATVQVKLTVNQLVAKGDREVSKQHYKEAFDQYTSAKALARNVLYDTAKLGLKGKITTVEAKLAETQVAPNSEELQAENEQKDQEKPRQPATPQASARSRWNVYDYTDKIEPPKGFFDEDSESGMADFCTIIDGALVMDTMANPAAGPTYKIGIQATRQAGLKFTVVVRAKAGAEYGMDFDFRALGLRERVRLLNGGIKLDSSGHKSSFFKTMEWHTYCISYEVINNADAARLYTKVYVDGASKPMVQGVSTMVDSNNYFRFGDESVSSGYIGAIDWIAWSFDDAYNPNQISLPEGFSLK
jgi:hypothetical protein